MELAPPLFGADSSSDDDNNNQLVMRAARQRSRSPPRRLRSLSPPSGGGFRGGFRGGYGGRGRGDGFRGGRGGRGRGLGRGGGGRFSPISRPVAPPISFRRRSRSRSRSRSPQHGGLFISPLSGIVPDAVSASASQSETNTEATTETTSPVKPPPILTRSKSLKELIKETTEASHEVLMNPPPTDAESVEIADYVIPDLPDQTVDDDTALLLTDALDITGMDFSLEITDELKDGSQDEEKKEDLLDDDEDTTTTATAGATTTTTTTTSTTGTTNTDGSNEKKKKKPLSDMEKMEIFSERTRQRCLNGLLYDSRFSLDLIIRCTIPNSTFVKTWRVNRTFVASCSSLFDSMLYPEDLATRRMRHKGKHYGCELFLTGLEEEESITLISKDDLLTKSSTQDSESTDTSTVSSPKEKSNNNNNTKDDDTVVAGLDDEVDYIDGVPVLDLGEIKAQFVEIIIRHAYFCDPKIPIDCAFEMRVVCEDFELLDLMKDCDEMLSNITPEGVCSLLSQSMKYDIKSLQINCINEIEANFRKKHMDRMFGSKTFREMPVQCLVTLVKSDLLRVKEEELFSHCLVWAESQSKLMEKRRIKQARTEAGIAEYGLDEAVEIIPKTTPKKKKKDSDEETSDKGSPEKGDAPSVDAEDEKKEESDSKTKEEVKLDDSALIDQLLPSSAAQEALKTMMNTNTNDNNEANPDGLGDEKTDIENKTEEGDELLIRGSEAYDCGQYPVLGTNGKPLIKPRDFLEEIKYFIRFPVMDPSFIATIVNKTGIFTEAEEYRIVKSILLKDSQLAKPFIRFERRSAGDFASSIHFVRGRGSSSWSYSGSKDCIEVTSNQECHLIGLGLWCGDNGSDAHVEIYRGRNEGGSLESRRLLITPEQEFVLTARNDTPIPLLFPEPFEMEAQQLYTIELHQVNREGSQSMQTESDGWGTAMTSVTHGTLTLTFSDAADSPNGTDTGSGAFPVFYVCT